MTLERFAELEARIRKVEDLLIRLDAIIDLIHQVVNRVNTLEEHDKEVMLMVHTTCDIKNKEIAAAREDSIRISTEHANNNHKQTWMVIATMFSLFIGAVIYFNTLTASQALEIKKHETQIESISKVLDKIDNKIDKLSERLETHNENR